jgi:hypothetical protein
MNRKKITVGALGLGVAGALAGGVAVAGAVGSPPGPGSGRPAASTATMPCWNDDDVPGRHAGGYGAATAFEAAAKHLGLTETQLRTRLQNGESLADLARAEGKSVTGLTDAIVAAVRERLQADTRLSAEQRNAMVARLGARVDAMVNAKHQPGAGLGLRLGRADVTGGHGPGAGMRGGMGPMGDGAGPMGDGMGRAGW